MKHSIASGTSNVMSCNPPLLKAAQNPVSTVTLLFHKDTQIYRQAILDTAYNKCAYPHKRLSTYRGFCPYFWNCHGLLILFCCYMGDRFSSCNGHLVFTNSRGYVRLARGTTFTLQ